jgi:hypothetical protein
VTFAVSRKFSMKTMRSSDIFLLRLIAARLLSAQSPGASGLNIAVSFVSFVFCDEAETEPRSS